MGFDALLPQSPTQPSLNLGIPSPRCVYFGWIGNRPPQTFSKSRNPVGSRLFGISAGGVCSRKFITSRR